MFKRTSNQIPDPLSFVVPYEPDVTLMRLEGGDLLLRWGNTAVSSTVHIYHSTNPDQINEFCKTVTNVTESTISGFDLTRRYYFRLQFEGGEWNGRTCIVAERVLPVGVNFRDVGGYETEDGRMTKWGKLFRAGALLDLSVAEMAYLERLGITAVCDLRTAEESFKYPNQLPDGARYEQLSVLNVARWAKWRGLFAVLFQREKLHDFMLEGYTQVMVDDNPQIVRRIFEIVADAGSLPVLIHCTAGKDRSGVTVALLLHSLGIPQETILADYTLSNYHYRAFKRLIEPDIANLRRLGIEADDLHAVLIVRRTLLETTFRHIDAQYGSFAAYLQDHVGIDDTIIGAVRSNLLIDKT